VGYIISLIARIKSANIFTWNLVCVWLFLHMQTNGDHGEGDFNI